MANQLLRGHWQTKHSHAADWKRKVWKCCWHLKPREPLKKAHLTLTRCSSVEPDFDGGVSGWKSVIDGLVEAGIIIDDKTSVIGTSTFMWQKAKKGEGKIIVKVEELDGCSEAQSSESKA